MVRAVHVNPARQPRPEPETHGCGVCGYFLFSPRRRKHTDGRDRLPRWRTRCRAEKALYVGISSYSTERTAVMAELMREWKIPLLIHQPSYNLLNRWVDKTGLLDALEKKRNGLYRLYPAGTGPAHRKIPWNGIPDGSRMQREGKKKCAA